MGIRSPFLHMAMIEVTSMMVSCHDVMDSVMIQNQVGAGLAPLGTLCVTQNAQGCKTDTRKPLKKFIHTRSYFYKSHYKK